MKNKILIFLFATVLLAGCKKLTDNPENWNYNTNELGHVFTPKVQLISIEDQYNDLYNYHYGTITYQVDLSDLTSGTGRSCRLDYYLEFLFSGQPVYTVIEGTKPVSVSGIKTYTITYTHMAPDQDLTLYLKFVLNGIERWNTGLDLGHFY